MDVAASTNVTRMSVIQTRIDALDWNALGESLTVNGYAVTPAILTPQECAGIVALCGDDSRFRSHVIMERHRFGVGGYKYFSHPLPDVVTALRASAYPHLAEVANRWAAALGETRPPYPANHAAFLEICHQAGQTRPTPLVLHYEANGYNCLHQDLYGDVAFPLQMASYSVNPGAIGRAVNSCLSSNNLARNRKPKSFPPAKARRFSSPHAIAQ